MPAQRGIGDPEALTVVHAPASEGSWLSADILGVAWALDGNGVHQAVPGCQSLVK